MGGKTESLRFFALGFLPNRVFLKKNDSEMANVSNGQRSKQQVFFAESSHFTATSGKESPKNLDEQNPSLRPRGKNTRAKDSTAKREII